MILMDVSLDLMRCSRDFNWSGSVSLVYTGFVGIKYYKIWFDFFFVKVHDWQKCKVLTRDSCYDLMHRQEYNYYTNTMFSH